MLYSAYLYECPAAVRYPRGEAPGVPIDEQFKEIPLGTWEVLREGADMAIIACGNMVHSASLAAEELAGEGIECSVVNGRFVKPMDRELLLRIAQQTGRILTVEENTIMGGFGSGIMELLSREGVTLPVKCLGIPDTFITHGSQNSLRNRIGLDREGISKAIREWLKKE